jgi:hypothetical protein
MPRRGSLIPYRAAYGGGEEAGKIQLTRWGGSSPITASRKVAPSGAAPAAALLPVVLPCLLMAVVVVLRHASTVWTSDSTAQQSILRTWLDVGHGTAYLPSDTWLLKIPLYAVVEALPLGPHGKLFVDALLLNILTFALLGWAAWALARLSPVAPRWYEVAMPLVWLAALGGGIGSNRMLLNYRNIELGLCFAAMALAAKYLSNRRGRRATHLGAAVALLTLFWLDDPYFALLVGLPFVAASLAWYLLRDRDARYLHLAAAVTASLALMPVMHRLAGTIGVVVMNKGSEVSLDPAQLLADLSFVWPGVAIQAGIDSGGGALGELTSAFLVLALAVTLAASTVLAWHGWRNRRFVPTFVGLHWPLVVAGYLASSYTQAHGSSRYLILAFYDLALGTALALPLIRHRAPRIASAALGMLGAGIVLNLITTALAVGGPPPALTQARQTQMDAVLSTDAPKGYAQFWSANVVTYLSDRKVTVNAVKCSGGHFSYDPWLTDTARYELTAMRSFLIWEPAAPYLSSCTRADVDRLLGPPAAAVDAGNGTTVLVYNRDIGPSMLSNPPA